MIYIHLSKDYSGDMFEPPVLGKLHVKTVYDVYSGDLLAFGGGSTLTIRGIDRSESSADSTISVVYDNAISSIW